MIFLLLRVHQDPISAPPNSLVAVIFPALILARTSLDALDDDRLLSQSAMLRLSYAVGWDRRKDRLLTCGRRMQRWAIT